MEESTPGTLGGQEVSGGEKVKKFARGASTKSPPALTSS